MFNIAHVRDTFDIESRSHLAELNQEYKAKNQALLEEVQRLENLLKNQQTPLNFK